MLKKKKPIPKSKKPLDKNLFSGLGEFSLLNNPYKPSNNFSLASNFNFTTPQVGSPMGGSNPFGLSSLGNTNTVTGEAVGNAAKASSGINAGAVIQGIQGTAETAKAIADIGKMNDYSDFTNSLDNERNQLNALSNTAYSANSTSDLLSKINNANQAANDIQQTEDITLESLTGTKAENDKKTLGAVGKGAAAGAAIGSIFPGAGTLIGAAVGAGIAGVGSGIANTFKQFKANRKLEELEEQKAEVDRQRKLALAQQQANLQVAANNLQINQANDIMTNYAALGGYLNMNTYNNGGPLFNEFNNGITIINEGGTHEENPYDGIQVGIDPEGVPNLVEEGEVIFNDYVFSDRLKVDENIRTKYKLRNTKELTFADAAEDIQKMSEEMPNDPIVRRTMELKLNQLMQEQEMVRQKKNKNKKSNRFDNGSWIRGIGYGLQSAPIITNAIDTFTKDTPITDYVNNYANAINEAYKPIEVKARTLSDYIKYNPYDISFDLNRLSASQAANRRALANTTNNPAALRASILASDYAYNNQIGEELRRAQEYNDANRRMVADFNRGTNQFNAQAINAANQFKTNINTQIMADKVNAIGNMNKWNQEVVYDALNKQTKEEQNLVTSVSNLGETLYNEGIRQMMLEKGVYVGADGKLHSLKNGGILNRTKKKRRLS